MKRKKPRPSARFARGTATALVVHLLPFNTYREDIRFVQGSAEQITRYFKCQHPKNDAPIIEGNVGKYVNWCANKDGYVIHYICLINLPKRRRDMVITTLSHEALHCAIAILEHRGVTISANEDEPLCYFHQWIMTLCLGWLR